MHRHVWWIALGAFLSFAHGDSNASAANSGAQIRRTLLTQQNVAGAPGLETQLWLIEYPPGATAPAHHHPVVGVGYVIEGEYESVFGDQPMTRVKAGESFVDQAQVEHRMFRNPSKDKPLRFVVAYTIPKGKQPVEMSELRTGSPVPDEPFILQDGFSLRLPAMKGKIIAAFFCSSVDDPQCQREAQVLAEHHAELRDEHHVVIIGVSPATAAAHKSWLAAQHLPLDFASDPDARLARAFGVRPARESMSMVVVDRDATIRALWHDADPERHVRELLAAAAAK